ncbi:MAG TPA: hypothetical protein VHB99_18955, partial [Pirellulales bacterium]|nr:hypothetical protein [Pirellulales bacterium]
MGENLAAESGSGLDIRPLATPGLAGGDKKSSPSAKSQSGGTKSPSTTDRGESGANRTRMPRAKPLADESAAVASSPEAAAPETTAAGTTAAEKDSSAKAKGSSSKPKSSKPASSTPGSTDGEAETKDATSDDSKKPHVPKRLLRASMALSFSTLVHLILVVILGMWFLPAIIKDQTGELEAFVETTPQELLNQVLETKVDPSKTLSLTSAAPVGGAAGAGGGGMQGLSQPTFDRSVAETGEISAMSVGNLSEFSTPGNHFSMDLPEGTLGEPQAVVDSYSEAMDRITQEILQMLAKGKVLVIWCFDESESMKDDQKEIRDRIERVYEELGLAESAQGDALWTAVASYGEGFHLHTQKPTSEIDEIRTAIGEVPID